MVADVDFASKGGALYSCYWGDVIVLAEIANRTEKDKKETKTVKTEKTDVLFLFGLCYNSALVLQRPKRMRMFL